MRLQDYPITTPYGWVQGYPLNQTDPVGHPGQGFHNGIDYGFPMGTPVVVNGVTIGISNNTGATTGPHLHIGKWVGSQVEDPGVGNGLTFDSAVVYDTGSDSLNGNYVRITADGALWNYLHLETILVTKGQVLEANMPSLATEDDVKRLLLAYMTPEQVASEGGDSYVQGFVGTELSSLIQSFTDSPQFLAKRQQEANSATVLQSNTLYKTP